jgi:hypothetical protein
MRCDSRPCTLGSVSPRRNLRSARRRRSLVCVAPRWRPLRALCEAARSPCEWRTRREVCDVRKMRAVREEREPVHEACEGSAR